MVKVLFVCLGNICRSPTAHGVFRQRVQEANLADHIYVDSAGTGDWHIGHPPDSRSAKVARGRGYDLSDLRARLVTPDDFAEFDYVLAMDRDNLRNLEILSPDDYKGHLDLFLNFGSSDEREVPDPYYGGPQGFDHVLDLVEEASDALLAHIRQQHGV